MAKRNSNQQSLKQAIDDLLGIYHLRKGVDQAAVAEAWQQVMGKAISNRTQRIQLMDGTLRIYLDSGVLKEEFSFEKPRIIELLNDELGRDVVKLIEIY
ncbi:MAG: DUF721 domain-containing protein [Flavobacteriales bacterium]|nr:DUF721 domain-containing protein [Flavobacteriales bacterium]